MESDDSSILPIQANWRAAIAGDPLITTVEFPLYSDASFIGDAQGLPPYSFLNTVPMTTLSGRVQYPVILRISVHKQLTGVSRYGSPKTTKLYHGGWISDEIAAVASLALGKRFKAGDESRRFDGPDTFGIPSAPRRRIEPILIFNSRRPVLPDVVADGDLRELNPRFQSIPYLSPDDCIALVRSARLYQDALWVAESEPNLAWLMLVSAVETAANRWRAKDATPIENFRMVMPDLAQKIQTDGSDELLELVSKKLSHLFGATKKFVDFVNEHLPPPPAVRPEGEASQVEWIPSNLKRILKIVYRYRSEALHGGTPFPAPMCSPADLFSANGAPVERGTAALAVHSLGGYWPADDLPISLHTFHYLARATLLCWWDSVALRCKDSPT